MQLMDRALQHHTEALPHPHRIGVCQVQHRVDAQRLQLRGHAPTHTPHRVYTQLGHGGMALKVVHGRQVTHAVQRRGGFGQVVGEFGQGFGGAKTGTHRQTGPLHGTLPDGLAQGAAAAVKRLQVLHPQETLVDAVDLHVGREVLQHRNHPAAHVAIQRVVGRQRHDAMLACQILQLEPGRGHFDAQFFGLGAAGHGAAVVVG